MVGAGTMGGGIAMSFADFGIPVKVLEASREVLDKGLERIRDNYAVSVKRGSLTQEEMDKRLPLIQPVESYEDIARLRRRDRGGVRAHATSRRRCSPSSTR